MTDPTTSPVSAPALLPFLKLFGPALMKLWPHGDNVVHGLRDGIITSAPAVFAKYGITSALVVAHAFAQFSEECGCGLEMQENMNYSAARLLQVFPTHFTRQQALALQHNPRAIANQAYGHRMGNRPGTDDGYDKRGQGLSQVTGNDNYTALAKKTGLDLVNHPELIISPEHALECGIADFILCGCLPYALKDSLVGVSSELNEGHFDPNVGHINGFSMRRQQLGLWKPALGVH
jgi:putative chitinase